MSAGADRGRFPRAVELLAPAGDSEALRFAVAYGADAVYLGLRRFGMRAGAGNFDPGALREAVDFAHGSGVRVYLTLNTVPTVAETRELPGAIREAAGAGVDAFIVADIGVMALVKEHAPGAEIHMSTQAGVMNAAAAREWHRLGAGRVVLARELSIGDIAAIRADTPKELQLECFVHGAVCLSVSGHCLLSQYMAGRDANRGDCAGSCRWRYALVEETRPGEHFPIDERDGYSFVLSARDLCMIEHLDKLWAAGVSGFKIEGRAKGFYYAAAVTGAYCRAVDWLLRDPEHYHCPESLVEELCKVSHRGYFTGFYLGQPADSIERHASYRRAYDVVAVVEGEAPGRALCSQRCKIEEGDLLEILIPPGKRVPASHETFIAAELRDEHGAPITATPHAMMRFSLKVPHSLPPLSILRRKRIH